MRKDSFYQDEAMKAKQINQLFKEQLQRWTRKITSSQYPNPPKQVIGKRTSRKKEEREM